MGTRLYVNTNDDSVVEDLFGASKGTVEYIENMRKCGTADMFYEWLYTDGNEDYLQIYNFTLYGFGKFDLSLVSEEDMCGGEEKDFEKCMRLLTSATNAGAVKFLGLIDTVRTYGLCWC